MEEDYKYPGGELELFRHARRWKKYFAGVLRPFINGRVLEAGAGIGATTELLNDGTCTEWWLTEPDTAMASILNKKITGQQLPANTRLLQNDSTGSEMLFDTIIYIDVLEHIEKDREELAMAANRLAKGGHLVVLSPAWQSLYSPFDKAIGHYRRYNKKMLKSISPDELKLVHCRYYDSMGCFASLANKLLLKQKMPTQKQVLFWDRWLVPVSTVTDKLVFHSFGKSIIAAWKK